MDKQTIPPEVVEVDDFWIHVDVGNDPSVPQEYQCVVSLFRRKSDSEWSDLDFSEPVDEPQVLQAFTTPGSALEHGFALGHILTSVY
jgi:hypothetical protein